MRIIIFSGTHPRHLFIQKEILKFASDCAAVVMEREPLIPDAPPGISDLDLGNLRRHFEARYDIERSAYGDLDVDQTFSSIPIHKCVPSNLNSTETLAFVKRFNAEVAFIFGTNLIKNPILAALPQANVNLHLGLSPWYRGSATLFWPFYFLEPNFAGATFHQLLPEADAGSILHQSVPRLRRGDGIHDVGVRTVLQAKEDLKLLLQGYTDLGWEFTPQRSTGRLFLTEDFQPAHLRVIYNTYNDRIVNLFLDGCIRTRTPNIIRNRIVTCSNPLNLA